MDSTYPEIQNIKEAMANMMELFVEEIDTIKKELYLDFGQTQKTMYEDFQLLKKKNEQLEDQIDQQELKFTEQIE